MKESFLSTLGILKFFFISVPIFLVIYITIEIYFQFKNLLQWIKK